MTNPARAFSDPSTGDRIYIGKTPKDRYVSVTSILSAALPKQQALVPWAGRVVAEVAVEVMQSIHDHPDHPSDYLSVYWDEDTSEYDWELIAKDLKDAWKWERDAAGTRGDVVHDALDQIVSASGGNYEMACATFEKMEDLHLLDDEAKRVKMFLDFLDKHKVETVGNEFTVFNDTHGYAGSCDLAAWVDGEPYYIDFKTSKSVYPETALQIAAYSHGEYIIDDHDGVHGMPFSGIGLNSINGAILHFQPSQLRMVEVDISDEIFDCFLSLLLVKRLWTDGGAKEAMGRVLYNSKKS